MEQYKVAVWPLIEGDRCTVYTVFKSGNKYTDFKYSLGIPYYCTWILWTSGNWLIHYVFVLSNSCSNLSNFDCKYNFVRFNSSFEWLFTSKKTLRAEVIMITKMTEPQKNQNNQRFWIIFIWTLFCSFISPDAEG